MQIPGYSDLTVLGRGGFSTVYRALQESVQRDVALKVLAVHMAGADAKARFRRECATNGRVGTHPNIVTLFDSGFADDGSPYLAMQLCGGGSLSERMRAGGAMPVAEVLRIGVKICAALQYAHSAGVLHRDIKPENILISDFGEPELADFGISSVDDQKLSTVTASSFTINHAAPETLAGRPSSVSSDIYSLSSTLFTLVAGRTPFNPPNSAAVIALVNMVMHEPAPGTGRPDVPGSLERLLAAGLSKTPAGRPTDAKAFGSALQRIQQELGLPVTEFPSAPPPLAFSPTQVFPAVGAAGVVGAVVTGVSADAVAPGAPGVAAVAAEAEVGTAGAGSAGPVGTGSLPPTGRMPAGGAIDTGSLPATGAMPTGSAPAASSADVSSADVSSTAGAPLVAPSSRWGGWADEVGAGEAAGPWIDPRSSPAFIPSALAPMAAPARAPVNAPPPDRRTWAWVAGSAVLLLLVATAVYLFAIRGTSSSTSTAPVVAGSSANSSLTSTAGTTGTATTAGTPTTRSSTSQPSTTRSSTSRTAPDVRPVISGFGSTTVPDGGEVTCDSATSLVAISLVWNSSNAVKAWIATDSSSGDASLSPHTEVPVANSSGQTVQFDCTTARHVYTLTVQNAGGTKTSSSVTYRTRLPAQTSSTSSSVTTTSSSTSTGSSSSTTSSSSSDSSTPGTSSPSTPTTPTTTSPPPASAGL